MILIWLSFVCTCKVPFLYWETTCWSAFGNFYSLSTKHLDGLLHVHYMYFKCILIGIHNWNWISIWVFSYFLLSVHFTKSHAVCSLFCLWNCYNLKYIHLQSINKCLIKVTLIYSRKWGNVIWSVNVSGLKRKSTAKCSTMC